MQSYTVKTPTFATPITETAPSTETALASRVGAALLTGGLGLVMLFGVGFAQIEVVHNAAHDTRHSVAFPCH